MDKSDLEGINLYKLLTISLILLGAGLHPARAAKQCSSTIIDDKTIDVTMGGRTVSLIGWQHHGVQDDEALGDLITSARKLTDANRCLEASELIANTTIQYKEIAQETKRALAQLQRAYDKYHFISLGIENAPEEVDEAMEIYNEHIGVLSDLNKTCPRQMDRAVEDFKFVLIQDPIYVFAEARRPEVIRVVGAENFALRQKAILNVNEANRAITQLQQVEAQMPDKIVKLLNRVFDDVSIKVTDDLISKICSDINDPGARELTRAALKTLKALDEGVIERNVAIAQFIKTQTGNFALLIGDDHIKDLSEKLVNLCQQDH